MCEESIEQPPTFVQSTESAEPDLAVVHTAPVCYVIVTRFPVADLHFKVLSDKVVHCALTVWCRSCLAFSHMSI